MRTGKREYDHIIWDWNGTLLDDAWLCVEIINGVLGRRNLPAISMQQYQEKFGFPVRDYYEQLGFDFSLESFESIALDFIREYGQRRHECRLHDASAGTLKRLAALQVSQSVLSAYHQASLEEMLDSFDLTGIFHKIFGLGDHYAHSKEERGLHLLQELGLPRDRILMVGDTIHDHEVAQAMGIDCILIPGGHQLRSRLESCGCPVPDSAAAILASVLSSSAAG